MFYYSNQLRKLDENLLQGEKLMYQNNTLFQIDIQ